MIFNRFVGLLINFVAIGFWAIGAYVLLNGVYITLGYFGSAVNL